MRFRLFFESATLPANIVNSKDDVYELLDASFEYGKLVGLEIENINNLHGGVRTGDAREMQRVEQLAQQISSPTGYIERLIVDSNGNVLEGQHRLEALRKLGINQVPIVRVMDLSKKYNVQAMKAAAMQSKTMHPDQLHNIINHAIQTLETAQSIEGALEYELPGEWNEPFEAAIKASFK